MGFSCLLWGNQPFHSMTRGVFFHARGCFWSYFGAPAGIILCPFPFFRGWVRIVSSFSGTSPGSTVCFCSFLAQRRARNDSLDFCALQHIKCSRSAVSEWRHCRSLSLNLSSKFSLDTEKLSCAPSWSIPRLPERVGVFLTRRVRDERE